MAVLIKNKNMAFSLILMCLIVVSPMAIAQIGVLPGVLNVANIQGLVTCSANGSVSTNGTVVLLSPVGVPVVLQCAGQTVSTTTTGANGVFSFAPITTLPILSSLLASGCRVNVAAPLSRCNASLPTNGVLTAPLNLAGITVSSGIGILQFVNGLFGLI